MEDTESHLLTLPRRPYNQPVRFDPKQQKLCVTNYYPIDLGQKFSKIYQFSFECSPDLPADSK